jgi:putative endonuclease
VFYREGYGWGTDMPMNKPFWTYITASGKNGTLYIGHTDDMPKRIWQHQTKQFKGFSAKYGCDTLVWCQAFDTREEAFAQERRLKEWRRAWKIQLIEKTNPEWQDLSLTINMWG